MIIFRLILRLAFLGRIQMYTLVGHHGKFTNTRKFSYAHKIIKYNMLTHSSLHSGLQNQQAVIPY